MLREHFPDTNMQEGVPQAIPTSAMQLKSNKNLPVHTDHRLKTGKEERRFWNLFFLSWGPTKKTQNSSA